MVKITATVEGMHCSMCENRVNTAVKEAFNVKSVASDHEKNQTVITAEEDIDAAELKKVIDSTGFAFKDAKSEPYKFSLFG